MRIYERMPVMREEEFVPNADATHSFIWSCPEGPGIIVDWLQSAYQLTDTKEVIRAAGGWKNVAEQLAGLARTKKELVDDWSRSWHEVPTEKGTLYVVVDSHIEHVFAPHGVDRDDLVRWASEFENKFSPNAKESRAVWVDEDEVVRARYSRKELFGTSDARGGYEKATFKWFLEQVKRMGGIQTSWERIPKSIDNVWYQVSAWRDPREPRDPALEQHFTADPAGLRDAKRYAKGLVDDGIAHSAEVAGWARFVSSSKGYGSYLIETMGEYRGREEEELKPNATHASVLDLRKVLLSDTSLFRSANKPEAEKFALQHGWRKAEVMRAGNRFSTFWVVGQCIGPAETLRLLNRDGSWVDMPWPGKF